MKRSFSLTSSIRRTARRAFTLVELLVVIAIIGILATLIFPMIGDAMLKAQVAKFSTQLGQIATAVENFKQQYGYYPTGLSAGTYALDDAAAANFYDCMQGNASVWGNRKFMQFYNFPDDLIDRDGTGAFQNFTVPIDGNSTITIVIDTDGNGQVSITGLTNPIAQSVAIYSVGPDGWADPATATSWDFDTDNIAD